jgi:hypothetical protein
MVILQVLMSIINVEVHSGVGLSHGFDATNLVPWRIGSERHLGITRWTTLDSTTDPPEYA